MVVMMRTFEASDIVHCIVCGERRDENHHCDESTIRRIEGGRRAHTDRHEYPLWYGTRLSDGFAMMSDDYNL